MKNLRKDNKGFSLVELIVVVLIMAIIAVALAPQVLKWVNNSRISNDIALKDTVVSAAQTALTNEEAYGYIKNTATKDFTITVTKTGVTFNDGDSDVSFPATNAVATGDGKVAIAKKVREYTGISAAADLHTASALGNTITVTIEHGTGKITSSYKNASGANVSIDN